MPVVISPLYPVAGELVRLTLTGATGTEVAFHVESRPDSSKVPLGVLYKQLGTRTAITVTEVLSFVDSEPDTISRSSGSFDEDGFRPGDVVDVGGTVSNNGRFTISNVGAQTLTLIATDELTTEAEVTATLTSVNTETAALAGNISDVEIENLENVVTFDAPGEYVIRANDIRHVIGSPSYEDDPVGDERLVYLSTQTTTVNVGELMDLPIVTEQGDGATLRLKVSDDTVRAAYLVEPTTEAARVAALQTTVTTPLAALVNQTVATIGGDFQARVENLRANFDAHALDALGTWHIVPDTVNDVTRFQADSQDSAIGLLNDLRGKLVGHLRQETSGLRFHTNDDEKSTPVVRSASSLGESNVLLSDLRERVYGRHIELNSADTPAIHTNAIVGPPKGGDTTNLLTAPTLLDDLIVAYLDALVDDTPTAPAGESEGAQDLIHMLGFKPATIV